MSEIVKPAGQTAPVDQPAGNKVKRMAVIWVDWRSYHVARYEALLAHSDLAGQVDGVELVGSGWKLAAELWKRLNRLDPEVLLVPNCNTIPGLAAALWGKLNRRRTVLMTENTQPGQRRARVKEFFTGVPLRALFDWTIASGEPHRRYLRRLGFRPDRIAGFNAVGDNDFFNERSQAIRRHSAPEEFDLPSKYFLYVGSLAGKKNVRGLLNAYLAYRRSGGSWALVLVGDGPERHTLEQMSAHSEFARDIRFEGLRTAAERPQYYAFASCLVLPSMREPWGMAVNEAMAAGLPLILSSRCGCVEDLLREGGNGCSFDPEIAGDLTACLTAISSLGPDSRLDMGCCSAGIISRFSLEAWAAEVARIANS